MFLNRVSSFQVLMPRKVSWTSRGLLSVGGDDRSCAISRPLNLNNLLAGSRQKHHVALARHYTPTIQSNLFIERTVNASDLQRFSFNLLVLNDGDGSAEQMTTLSTEDDPSAGPALPRLRSVSQIEHDTEI